MEARLSVKPTEKTADEYAEERIVEQMWRCCRLGLRAVAITGIVVLFAIFMIDQALDFWAWLR